VKYWAILICLPFLTACSMFDTSPEVASGATVIPPQVVTLPVNEQQRRWWAAHREIAKQVPGRGWQVPGYPGFYTDQGARIVPPEIQVSDAEVIAARSENQLSGTERLLDDSRSLIGQGRDEPLARKMLAEGHAFYNQRKFAEADEKFREASERWPDSPLAEDALFLSAECQFFTDEYPDARKQYEELLAKYTNSRYLDTSVQRLFAIAQYWEKVQAESPKHLYNPNFTDETRPYTNAGSAASEVYRKVYLNHPTGPLADDAIMAIAAASYRASSWEQADYHYTLLRNEYPTSKHQFDAHLLGLQTKYNMYQGPFYDQKALAECKKLSERLLKQFPDQLANRSERDRVEKMAAEVEAQGALREWQMAQYYQKNGHNRAAKLYYGNLMKEYPQSEFAQRAREEIIALGGQPEVPPPRFAWLTDLFDDTTQQ
jgi:outer membrane protein assembly factor BamD (BamD/ComL family)